MKKILALVLSLVLVAGLSTAALADVTVSWYNFGDAFSSYVRDYASAKFEALGIPFVNKDSNNIQQTQNDDLQTAVVTGTDALVVQMVDSGAYATAKNILQMGVDAGIPVVFFSRVMSTNNDECAELVGSYDKTIYVGTDPAEAGVYQGQMIGEYLVANYDAVDLNGHTLYVNGTPYTGGTSSGTAIEFPASSSSDGHHPGEKPGDPPPGDNAGRAPGGEPPEKPDGEPPQ